MKWVDKHTNWLNYVNNYSPKEIEIILDDMEFAWKKSDLELLIKLWQQGYHFKKICERVARPGDEVFLALLHLSRKRKIKMRDNYIWGKE